MSQLVFNPIVIDCQDMMEVKQYALQLATVLQQAPPNQPKPLKAWIDPASGLSVVFSDENSINLPVVQLRSGRPSAELAAESLYYLGFGGPAPDGLTARIQYARQTVYVDATHPATTELPIR